MSTDSTQSGVGNSASKRSRGEEVDGTGVDRIGDLPESLLLLILSFLSSIYVVRTSVLSRRWRHLWTCVPCLKFGSEKKVRRLRDEEESETFVNRFLLQYKATSIQKFRIGYRLQYSSDMEIWIRWAVSRNVEELDISFSDCYLPQTIFGCRTLVVLKLKGNPVSMAFPPSACIPCLKTLELDAVTSSDAEFENKLISCCVVLENLSILWYGGLEESYRIHAQHLKRCKIHVFPQYDSEDDDTYVIAINAPSLEDLDIGVSGKYSLLLENVGNLRKAKIILDDSNAFQSLLKCSSALKNVKCLFLSSMPPHTKQACILVPGPMVRNVNLTHLTLGCRSIWTQLLPYFFDCFPNLQVLRLKKDPFSCKYAGKLCTEPKLLPTGLLSHLRVIVAENFSGTNDELGMLKYILKNGKVLDLVQLQYRSPIGKQYTTPFGTKAREIEQKFIAREEEGCKHQLAQKILEYPRASQKCKLIWFDAKLEAS